MVLVAQQLLYLSLAVRHLAHRRFVWRWRVGSVRVLGRQSRERLGRGPENVILTLGSGPELLVLPH